MKPFQIIAILAKDWAGEQNATEHFDQDEIELVVPVEGWITGWRIKETDEYITICRDYFPETGLYRCPVSITKSSIIQRIDYAIP